MTLWQQTSAGLTVGPSDQGRNRPEPAPIPFVSEAGIDAAWLVHRFGNQLDLILANARRRYTQALLRIGDRLTRRWAEERGLPYLDEIGRVAQVVGQPGVWMLNFSYEWGCTTAAVPEPDGRPRLLRTLDWEMAGLGRAMVAVRQEGEAGPYLNLTWPGFAGVVQAVAPGRFAASVNQAPAPATPFGAVGDWLNAKRVIWASRAMPPVLLLRRAFDRCRTFAEAKLMLAEAPVCAPVLYSLVGCRPGETALIERGHDGTFVHDRLEAVANHWLNDSLSGVSRSWCSAERLDAMRAHVAARAPGGSPFAWLKDPILNDKTRLAMEAVPATGEVWMQGYEAEGAVTEVGKVAA